jgi:ADP-dependent NAD(P)H-hydrate dehydratase / NAD(P)H-hydrate epimerase
MQILSAEQVRAWDEFTIQHEPVSSIDLMERAAESCFNWLEAHGFTSSPFSICCGKGNNGGDGLAIARMLAVHGSEVSVHILEFGHKGTEDFQQNLSRLHGSAVQVRFVQSAEHFPAVAPGEIIIDALLGSGLNRPVEGVTAELVHYLNQCDNTTISIDIPSGLFVDKSSKGNPVIIANHTLTFQCLKPALLVAENGQYTGNVQVLDIGLHPGFPGKDAPVHHWIDQSMVKAMYRPRKSFSHKGTYGHALLVAGSYGKMGAAVLAARACLRSGAGLVTLHVPRCGLQVLQTAVPEAMCMVDQDEHAVTSLYEDLPAFTAVGLGPGLGKDTRTASMLERFFKLVRQPAVLDADALNIIGLNPHLLNEIPPHSILTPHPKEFERLFGPAENDFDKLRLAAEKARLHNIVIVLKGHHTFIAMPDGRTFFNSTGNPGMATGGTGDVLTGILTGLLAQGYAPEAAAVFGVYWHGLAGDLAAAEHTQEVMVASDLVEQLGHVLKRIVEG